MTNKRVNSSRFPMTSRRWNPAWKFQPTQEIANQTDRFLPVGWFWRAGASTPVTVCEMVWEEIAGDTERYTKHKMIKEN